MKMWVITGVPPGAQARAAAAGHARIERMHREGRTNATQKHRVKGQRVEVIGDRGMAEARAGEWSAEGMIVTFRRWRPGCGR